MTGKILGYFKRNGVTHPIVGRIRFPANSILENSARLKAVVGLSEQEKLRRAKAVDLITLPDGISGTNCGNCSYFAKAPGMSTGLCIHPKVRMGVQENQCCILWNAPGTKRAWKN